MNEISVNEELHKIFRRVFPNLTRSVSLTDSVETIDDWDSLGHLRLMLAVEEKFGLKFTATEMLEFITVEKIQTYLTAGKKI